MKVRMLKNCISTIDGFRIRYFYKHEIYDLREFIATNLINQKKAVFLPDNKQQQENFLTGEQNG